MVCAWCCTPSLQVPTRLAVLSRLWPMIALLQSPTDCLTAFAHAWRAALALALDSTAAAAQGAQQQQQQQRMSVAQQVWAGAHWQGWHRCPHQLGAGVAVRGAGCAAGAEEVEEASRQVGIEERSHGQEVRCLLQQQQQQQQQQQRQAG